MPKLYHGNIDLVLQDKTHKAQVFAHRLETLKEMLTALAMDAKGPCFDSGEFLACRPATPKCTLHGCLYDEKGA